MMLVLVSTLLLARNIVNTSFSAKSAAFTDKINLNTQGFKKAKIMHYAAILEKNPVCRTAINAAGRNIIPVGAAYKRQAII